MMRISNEDLGVVNCANPSWLADDKKSWVFELQDCQVTSAPDLWPPLQMLAMLTMYNVKCTICKKSWVGWWRKTVGNANACYAHKVSLQSAISAEAGRDLGADRWQTFIVQQTVCILFTPPSSTSCLHIRYIHSRLYLKGSGRLYQLLATERMKGEWASTLHQLSQLPPHLHCLPLFHFTLRWNTVWGGEVHAWHYGKGWTSKSVGSQLKGEGGVGPSHLGDWKIDFVMQLESGGAQCTQPGWGSLFHMELPCSLKCDTVCHICQVMIHAARIHHHVCIQYIHHVYALHIAKEMW